MQENTTVLVDGKEYRKEFLREVSEETIQQFGGRVKYCAFLNTTYAPFTYIDGIHTMEGNNLYRIQPAKNSLV